jgi:hypothetical protein
MISTKKVKIHEENRSIILTPDQLFNISIRLLLI